MSTRAYGSSIQPSTMSTHARGQEFTGVKLGGGEPAFISTTVQLFHVDRTCLLKKKEQRRAQLAAVMYAFVYLS